MRHFHPHNLSFFLYMQEAMTVKHVITYTPVNYMSVVYWCAFLLSIFLALSISYFMPPLHFSLYLLFFFPTFVQLGS